jgi:hypothetical protein
MNDLAGTQDMRRGDAGPSSANIQGFRQFHKLGSRQIGPPYKDRHLEPDARRAARWRIFQVLAFLQ